MSQSEAMHTWRLHADRATRNTGRHVQTVLGGQRRSRVVVVLACVLALNSADSSTVGASAVYLRSSLHIGNTDIGLLVTVSSLVAAVASIPFGIVADRWNRTRTLAAMIVLWGIAMLWSATAQNFHELLLARLMLGLVTAAAGPIVASLIGDYFAAGERGRIYSYILTGELVGSGIGFSVTGDIAALSWRLAFVILAFPAFMLAWYVFRTAEPVRGGLRPLLPDGVDMPASDVEDKPTGPTDAQRLAAERGVEPDPDLVLHRVRSLGIISAVRAVLRIKTNVILIVASACGYFYLSGVATFGAEFVKQQYRIPTAVANLLLLVVGGGAVIGVVVAGGLSDRLLHRGFLNSRILIPAISALAATVLFVPALSTRSAITAVPYLAMAALMLSAQNPPIDAARLDIVPALLWGRAEGIRTALRTMAQSLAPITFGAASDHVFGGGRVGLQRTFGVMLVVMAASGVVLMRGLRTYPRDVATAAAAGDAEPAPADQAPPSGAEPPPPSGAEPPPPSGAEPPPPPSSPPPETATEDDELPWPKPAVTSEWVDPPVQPAPDIP